MTRVKNHFLLIASVFVLASCSDLFDYSPYVISFDDDNTNVNLLNKNLLQKENVPATLKIAFTGDTHRHSDELNDFVNAVNSLKGDAAVSFVVHVGDIADFGLPKQYLWGNAYLLNLECPYFVLVGNHDLVSNGSEAYQEMFGPLNFSFVFGDLKFIFLNTNSREYKFNGEVPDLQWMDEELKPSDDFRKAIVLFHVPPDDDDFDPALREGFYKTLGKYNNVLLAVHGHAHHHEEYFPNDDSILFVNVYGVEYRKYNVITIANDSVQIKAHTF